MPELPDVEVFRRYLEKTSLDQEIKDVEADKSILTGISAADMKKALCGHCFSSARRHGKYLFAGTDKSGQWLVMHFGMTGYPLYYTDEPTPKYARLQIRFSGGGNLAFNCRRKLGRIRLTVDPDAFIRGMGLGPDALEEGFDDAAFIGRLSKRRASIKSAMMNQSVMAGIGNIYADEILYQARIHPKRETGNISAHEMAALFRVMRRVLAEAVEAGAEPENMPENFLIHHRRPGAKCPACGGSVEKIAVSGRNGYCCPVCQK